MAGTLQDHQGISNAAPADVPLRRLSIPRVSGVSGMEANSEEASIHDYISNLKFRISPTAFFQVTTSGYFVVFLSSEVCF